MAGVAAFFAASIFTQRDVANPVLAFDPPMPAVEVQEFGGVGLRAGQAGDGVGDFARFFALFARDTFDATDLLQAGPIEMPSQARTGF
jgi:hypothetical protein